MEAACSLSGGMDSSTPAGVTKNSGYDISALHRNYGQCTEGKELTCAMKIASLLETGAGILTESRMIAGAFHLEHQHLPDTYVPCRNEAFAAAGIRDRYEV